MLLGREYRVSRDTILDLAELPADQQRELVGELTVNKRLPRGWRNNGQPLTISYPRGLLSRAAAILKREGRDVAVELARLLVQAAEAAGKEAAPPPSSGASAETSGEPENPGPSNG